MAEFPVEMKWSMVYWFEIYRVSVGFSLFCSSFCSKPQIKHVTLIMRLNLSFTCILLYCICDMKESQLLRIIESFGAIDINFHNKKIAHYLSQTSSMMLHILDLFLSFGFNVSLHCK